MASRRLVIVTGTLVLAVAFVTALVVPRFVPGLRAPIPVAAGALPPLARANAWFDTAPLTADSLRGRPVALLFWRDTDPLGLAALPVAEAWYREFAPLGARVVAVHEAEFSFAQHPAVAAAVAKRLGLSLPVADDSTGFIEGLLGGMDEGPRVVVADASGRLVSDTVAALAQGQRALAGAVRDARRAAGLATPGELAPLDVSLPTGERTVHLGAGRVESGPLRVLPPGRDEVFTAEFRYEESGEPWAPYPVGGWRTGVEGVLATRGGAANFIAIRYSAARAGVVVTPPAGGSAKFWILRDDRWQRPEERDEDVTADARGAGSVLVTEPRIYWLDRGTGTRVLKISPETPGATVNAFVFTGAR
ncbi:MAG TPA: hypothetical protein VMH61_02450 [Candidatus Acidoferrales bacterium]|nr:hypothetical protein [Candidatus Acidoferrales bacterium]